MHVIKCSDEQRHGGLARQAVQVRHAVDTGAAAASFIAPPSVPLADLFSSSDLPNFVLSSLKYAATSRSVPTIRKTVDVLCV